METRWRRELVRVGKLLYDRGYVVAAEGNLSVRLGGGLFLVTPAGACKGMLQPEDLLVVGADGGRRRGAGAARPSSEWLLHAGIYERRPDVTAICHAHPPWATAWAAAGVALSGCLLPEIVLGLGRVPLTPYATPGTPEVPAAVGPLIAEHDTVLLANHGVVAVGADPLQAYFRLESVERLSQVTLLARLAGGERRLDRAQVAALLAAGLRGEPPPPPCVAAGEGPEGTD